MPVRARSADEERYLFAQLVSAACRIEVSWHLGAPGSVMSRSAFVADLLRAGSPDPLAPPVWSSCRADLGPRPPYEHAILAAGSGRREDLPPLISAAIGAGRAGGIADRAGELARARADILDQVDPERPVEGPNPWFGFVGGAYPEEPSGPSVTAIEDFAECPLASFVTRRLGVAPTPDPQLGLPDPRGRLVGEVVHRVLENVVHESFEAPELTDFAGVSDREPRIVVWPSPKRIEAMLTHVSRQVADEAGLGPLGMATLLAARSRPYIEVARRVDWGPANRLSTVVATEVSGAVRLEGLEWPIRFRADRVDLAEDALILTDYKTGRPPSGAKNSSTRNKRLLTEVERGRKLQAAVYAAAPSVGGAKGRYLWLRPDIGDAPEASRWAVIGTEETAYRIALERAATAVGLARKMGATFPRVEEVGSKDKPGHCKYCPVAEACRRDDSGFRRRFVAWMEKGDQPAGPAESAARALWRLGVPAEDGS
jgi:RecB family exonuclease